MTTPADIQSRYQACLAVLKPRGQDHVLRWWDELEPGRREHLLADIESIPWDIVDPLIRSHVLQCPRRSIPTDPSPPQVYKQRPAPGQEALYNDAVRTGRDLLHAGKVAAFTVAGGQGTRLGFDGPKGAVEVTPVGRKTLFELFAEMITAARKRYETSIPWYVMTSTANHDQTVRFFADYDFFGLPKQDVFMFTQGMLPLFSFDGRILMSDKGRIALGPDGHGGSLKALVKSGALQDMQSRGVGVISYFQVDNPLVKPFDPLFIGLHVETGSEMSCKVTPKADDLERVGNLCVGDGKLTVVEYSDFPDELAHARTADGGRKFDAGNLAIHLLSLEFIGRVAQQSFEIPFRRAEKAVDYLDETGQPRHPSTPNAVKLEMFIFDALPLAGSPLVLEVDRAEEFSPVKNAKGVDSLDTARRDQIRRACRWLESAGVSVPRKPDGQPNVVIAISAAFALDAGDVKANVHRLPTLKPDDALYIA